MEMTSQLLLEMTMDYSQSMQHHGVISTTATALNYESATSHTLTISVSDGTNANTVTQDVTISVTDVDEFDAAAPADSNNDANTVAENAANGATVGLDCFNF